MGGCKQGDITLLPSDLSALHKAYNPFRIPVVAFGIVFLVEVETEDKADSLVEVCTEGTDESLCDVVARHVAFAVDKLYQQASL